MPRSGRRRRLAATAKKSEEEENRCLLSEEGGSLLPGPEEEDLEREQREAVLSVLPGPEEEEPVGPRSEEEEPVGPGSEEEGPRGSGQRMEAHAVGRSEEEGVRSQRLEEEEAVKALNVLLLGRLNPRRAGGGIARSAHLIAGALRNVGDQVLLLDSRGDSPVLSGTDVVIHYSDLEGVSGHISRAKAAGVPILINASYDGTHKRCEWIVDTLIRWQQDYSGVRMFVFSAAARNDYRLSLVRRSLVVLPKTVRTSSATTSFEQREGICLGELAKACKRRIVGTGPDAREAVRMLSEALPGVPLHFYDQYACGASAPGKAQVHGYRSRGFVGGLGRFRLFISLSAHETFAMVPAEAQSAGTVVLYRDQPQSLNEHIGPTGVSFETVEEMVMAAKALYRNKELWQQYSVAGGYNAAGRSWQQMGAALDMALRKAIL